MRPRLLALAALTLLAAGCESEDPRLPDRLYEEAKSLTAKGRSEEGKAMLERIAEKYRDTEAGRRAVKDLFIINTTMKEDQARETQQVSGSMKRIADALGRYKGKRGEYPFTLNELVPEYLDQVPLTPWGHPFLYRPYVTNPVEEVRDRRGNISQHFNTRLDSYHLVCLGRDLAPGGKEASADIMIKDGEVITNGMLPPVPPLQPVR
jgi:hypothetical protein